DYIFDIDITSVLSINRTLIMVVNATPVTVVDSDSDGIPDELDQFPNDATRATTVRFPASGHETVAFEDLFPKQGDADFNDFVVRTVHEEDLDGLGRIARIRGSYTHMAKGAGYNHTLHVNITDTVGGSMVVRRYGSDGALLSEETRSLETLTAIDLMPRSDT